jgi:hypothetical protein
LHEAPEELSAAVPPPSPALKEMEQESKRASENGKPAPQKNLEPS